MSFTISLCIFSHITANIKGSSKAPVKLRLGNDEDVLGKKKKSVLKLKHGGGADRRNYGLHTNTAATPFDLC